VCKEKRSSPFFLFVQSYVFSNPKIVQKKNKNQKIQHFQEVSKIFLVVWHGICSNKYV